MLPGVSLLRSLRELRRAGRLRLAHRSAAAVNRAKVGIVPDNLVKELSWGVQGPQRCGGGSMPWLQAQSTEYSANGSFTAPRDAGFKDPALRVLPFGSPHCTQSFSRAFEKYIYGQASRLISIGKLNASPRLHTRPINLVIFQGSSGPCGRDTSS